jgi:2-polyprenyl-3-methyl-5-hydroxy-6-metoxy-1,4-benzoquinol methylase
MNNLKEESERTELVQGSFRDPSGFVFRKNKIVYRQINNKYKREYDQLIESGLYKTLVEEELLIPHEEVSLDLSQSKDSYKVIKPDQLDFISYPYEWSFSQLKDAALLTLKIQQKAINFGMSLKDSNSFNIQFKNGKPIFIDTLSFEMSDMNKPWNAYRQFCQHFYAPLAIMSYKDIRLNQLLKIYIDGIPLDLASKLLPKKTNFSFSLLTHIHLHAKSEMSYSRKTQKIKSRKISPAGFQGIINSLENGIKRLRWKPKGTEWADYYDDTNYDDDAFIKKKEIISNFINKIDSKMVWDLGANQGIFSRLASNKKITTIAFDIDYSAVDKNYSECKKNREQNLLPLLLDLTNPTPGIGWQNLERTSFINRGPVDTVLALALIHHLAISNNLPLQKIACFLYEICNSLIIEFIPKSDSQIQRLLINREDIFNNYTQENFEEEFSRYFKILEFKKIINSDRTLYLMKKL